MNNQLFNQIYNLSNHNQVLDYLMVFGAEIAIFLAVLFAVVGALRGSIKDKKALFIFLISLLLAYFLVKLMRVLLLIDRPEKALEIVPLITTPNRPSFPSVHTTIMATLTFSFMYYRSKLSIFLTLLLFWVGFSRIYVGVHFPLDILGGVFTGFLSTSITWSLKKLLKQRLGI